MTSGGPSVRSDVFVRTPDGASDGPRDVWIETAASPEFRELRSRLLRFVVPATVGFLAWFFLYIGLNAWAPDLMGVHVAGGVTLVLVVAVGQFVSTFVITAFYARYARRRLDPLADSIRTRLEGGAR